MNASLKSMVVLAQEMPTGGSLHIIEALVITVLTVLLLGWIAGRVARDTDRLWLQRFVVWGYLAKVVGSLARYWMVTGLYESGDSYSYHFAGEGFATVWRSLVVPQSTAGGQGTAFTEVVTGLLYAFYTPTFLGGFLFFATLAFFGQFFFYTAFRRWFGPKKQRLYGMAVFFFPSLVFWPSSIGKDALMVFFLGIAAYGASKLLFTHRILSSGLIIAIGLVLAAGVRPHVAGMFAISLVLAVLLGKAPTDLKGGPKKPIMLLGAAAGAALVLATFSTTFEVGIDADRTQTDIGGFLQDVSQQTAQGGSEIDGVAITTPSRLPIAVITVLFRPLIHEGANLQMLASALEGTVLLGIVVWKFPQMWRNRGLLRRKAYLTLCFFYTGGFIIGFSAILNLGILARQRVQLIPIFLALVIALGWPEETEPDAAEAADSSKQHPRPLRQASYLAASASPALDTTSPRGRLDRPDIAQSAAGFDPVDAPTENGEPGSAAPEPNDGAAPVEDNDEARLASPIANDESAVPEAHTRPNGRRGRHVSNAPGLRDRIRPHVVELRTSNPDMSVQEIARLVEASPTTVRRVLLEEELD